MGSVGLKSSVELFFSAEALPNLDSGSKSDCFLVIFSLKNGIKTRVGTTEIIPNNLAPTWVNTILVDYFFEEAQQFVAEIYDADSAKSLEDLKKHDYIGSLEFKLSQVISGRN